MGDRNDVTATSFRVTVSAAEPYSFQACATQQVQSSVRITHITFTPPSAEEAAAYMQHQQKDAGTAAAPSGDKRSKNKDNDNTSVAVRPATLASLRTLCASGKMESHLVACFPWTVTGDAASA
ncbi:hypothetical protein DQ04_26771000, partial [Trypanosoma grayi]|uniref:hypothetical protein n=1 Tax=Trypanosoma grayi TaxID=71804 RepID=UPI0004F47712